MGSEHGAALCMMRNLEVERVALAAMSVGIAKRCLQVMNAYANDRAQFGKPLNEFGQVQRHLAESYSEYRAGRSYVCVLLGVFFNKSATPFFYTSLAR